MTAEAAAIDAVRDHDDRVPAVALILGSGLGALGDELDNATTIPFRDIPGFPTAAVAGHAGRLLLGELAGVTCVTLQGRFHLYEGHDAATVALPTRVMLGLGARALIVTNAAGGINPGFEPGDVMLIEDHINLTGRNPLVGPVVEGETRFPDMTAPYDPALRELAVRVAAADGLRLAQGVYAAVLGPSYETPAEIRMLATLGADAVGMSTVPEVLAARARGARVLGISLISNAAAGLSPVPLTHDEVVAAGVEARGRFSRLVRGILRGIPDLLAEGAS
jgi:purine-nucleoside phosphorylase